MGSGRGCGGEDGEMDCVSGCVPCRSAVCVQCVEEHCSRLMTEVEAAVKGGLPVAACVLCRVLGETSGTSVLLCVVPGGSMCSVQGYFLRAVIVKKTNR